MLLNILHFFASKFFAYFPPLKPRCVLWSEKYSNSVLYITCEPKNLRNHLIKAYHFINEGSQVTEASGVSLKLKTLNSQMS